MGDVGDTEPLMTRDELADMTDGSLLKWDGTNKKAVCAQRADIIPSDASTSNKLATGASVNAELADYYAQKNLGGVREKRVGEIYNSNGYWKVTMKGYYARPIVFKCIGTLGLYDIVMFGQTCTPKLIRLGNESTQVTYKYTQPTSSGSDGILYIKSNLANASHTIFSIAVYGEDLIGTLESCTQEEYDNATAF